MNRLDEIKIDIIRRVVNMSSEKKLQQLLDIVKHEHRKSPREFKPGAWPLYEGFGETHTCGQWARIAGLHPNSFRRYLQQGLTVEEIFEKRHCDPPIK